MRSPAYSVARYLEANGFGVFGAPAGWSINVAAEPEAPDAAITVYDTGGEATDTEGATGTVHGAIASGRRAASQVIRALQARS